VLWRQGSYGDYLAFVVSGRLQVSRELRVTEHSRYPVSTQRWHCTRVTRPLRVPCAAVHTKGIVGQEMLVHCLKREFTIKSVALSMAFSCFCFSQTSVDRFVTLDA
jgi:hypothetical protein